MSHSQKPTSSPELVEAYERGYEEARAEEAARWRTVMSSTDTAGRNALAVSLLANSSEPAEKICAILLASPVTSEADAVRDKADWFLHMIGKVAGANVTPLHGETANIVRAYRRDTGQPPEAA